MAKISKSDMTKEEAIDLWVDNCRSTPGYSLSAFPVHYDIRMENVLDNGALIVNVKARMLFVVGFYNSEFNGKSQSFEITETEYQKMKSEWISNQK